MFGIVSRCFEPKCVFLFCSEGFRPHRRGRAGANLNLLSSWTGEDMTRVGAQSGVGPIWALMGPYVGLYGPLWAYIWAHIWANMGPYGSSWAGLGRLRELSVRLLDQFRTFGFKI